MGGKRQLLPGLLEMTPEKFTRYHEPFAGGAALFFELKRLGRIQDHARLVEKNEDLVAAYRAVKFDIDALVASLKPLKANKSTFERLRREDPKMLDPLGRAVRTIYLLKTCFNGLWRVNKKGEYNAPFALPNATICDEENLRACHAALHNTSVEAGDFSSVEKFAYAGDFVYFDPPYLPAGESTSFASFTEDGFSLDDHIRLRDLALRLKKAGVHVLLSNSGGKLTRELYSRDFDLRAVKARRNINSDGAGRGEVREYLIR